MNTLCIVIQGPSNNVTLLKQNYSNSNLPLIFSTWKGEESKYDENDIVIFNDIPVEKGTQNVMMQQHSTYMGLLKAKELGFMYAIKIRSDSYFTNVNNFIKDIDYNKLNFLFHLNYFRNDNNLYYNYLCDYCQISNIDLLLKCWNFKYEDCDYSEALFTKHIFQNINLNLLNFIGNKLIKDTNDIVWTKHNLYLSTLNTEINYKTEIILPRVAILFNGQLRENEKQNIDNISNVVKKMYYNLLPNYKIDYYMHTWDNVDTTKYLPFTDNIDNLIVEDNNKYYDSINLIFENTRSNLRNHPEYNWQINRSFAQISCLISKKRVIELFEQNRKCDYDFVIFSRPDYIIWEHTDIIPIKLGDTLYLNKQGPAISSGESIFILHQNNLQYFTSMYNDMMSYKIIPFCHGWYYDYLSKKCNIELSKCGVGENCEKISLLRIYLKNTNLYNFLLENKEIINFI
jgi:hypothetical protein